MFLCSVFHCPISYGHDRQIQTRINVSLSTKPKVSCGPARNLEENKDISATFSSQSAPQTHCDAHQSQTTKDSMNCSQRKGMSRELWHSLGLHLLSALKGTGMVRAQRVCAEAPSPFCWAPTEHSLPFSPLHLHDRDQNELSCLF